MFTENNQFTLSPKHFQLFLNCITCNHSENFLECFRPMDDEDSIESIKALENWAKDSLQEDEKDEEELIIEPLLKEYNLTGELKHIKAHTYHYTSNGENHGQSLSRCLFSKNPEVFAVAEVILDILYEMFQDDFGWDN
jgi:hypothetical protein